MARYIDADAVHKFVEQKVTEGKDGWSNGVPYEWEYALTVIDMQPAADVVPKSEVDKLEQDVTRLVQEKDALVKNYAECMRDYAREIFEDIRKCRVVGLYGIHGYLKEDIDDIEKKYTEQCPKCKHFVGCECFSGMTCDEYEEGKT